MSLLKWMVRGLFGEYELYRIYRLDLTDLEPLHQMRADLGPIEDLTEIAKSPDLELQGLGAYAGDEAYGFGARVNGALASVCWFWAGERYRRRNFWRLGAGEAKLVQITTAARFQGQGVASELIRFGAHRMMLAGFRRAYARIWHSNLASIRLFERAGWTYVAFVALIHPLRSPRSVRLVWRKRAR